MSFERFSVSESELDLLGSDVVEEEDEDLPWLVELDELVPPAASG